LSTQKAIYLAVGVVLGFIVGFALANGINGREQEEMRGELTRLRAGASKTAEVEGLTGASESKDASLPTLSEDELRKAVAKADASPDDAKLQRQAGQGLYIYAMQTGNSALLPDVARILKRAHEADPKDYPITVLAGNAHFLAARSGGDTEALTEARKYYEQALAAKSDDIVVRTSLGLTYFFARPPDAARAVREYRKALEIDSRHELPLQSMVAALIETGELAEAEKMLGELEGVNSANKELPNLRAQLAQKRNAAKEKK
jgi:tetratricopeptide (TPR) repeat protein